MAQGTPQETLTLLARLSHKPGVRSTLILSRDSGKIVRSSGLVVASTQPVTDSPGAEVTENPSSSLASNKAEADKLDRPSSSSGPSNGKGLNVAEEVASMVWNFFGSAKGLVEDMMGEEDEVKLIRLRMKRHEVMVVPGEQVLLLHSGVNVP